MFLQRCITYTDISESVRHLHVFNNNFAVLDVLETIFFSIQTHWMGVKNYTSAF